MATKLTTSRFGIGGRSSFGSNISKNKKNGDVNNVSFIFLTCHRFLPVSCKPRHRDLRETHVTRTSEGLPSIHLEDSSGMTRNAENGTWVRALQDVERIVPEKQTLLEEINALKMRMADTEQLLDSQLQQLRSEMKQREASERARPNTMERVLPDTYKNQNKQSLVLENRSVRSVGEELVLLRKENMSLKNDIEALKIERSILESSVRDLESKLSASQEDVSKLSALKIECESLWEEVENLQTLLSKITKQANQAIVVLQQNQYLRHKVDKLEESFEKLLQQKIRLLEDHLLKSDEEIYSYIKLYQDSTHEFPDTLNSLKEENKRRAPDEPVPDMLRDFWSSLLLMIDGWLLEKKISINDANILRKMAWKRKRCILDTYIECIGRNENEAISMFLKLTSSPKRDGICR